MSASNPIPTVTEEASCLPIAVAIPAYLMPILRLFAAHGEAAYPVGGCVRDSLRGVEPHDWDVAVTTPPERTQALCEAAGYRVIPTGIAHGTVTILAPLSGDPIDHTGDYAPVECTTCRTEGSYTDSRHPDRVSFTGRIEDDLSRRDFTVNAMAFVISPCFPTVAQPCKTVASPCLKNAENADFSENLSPNPPSSDVRADDRSSVAVTAQPQADSPSVAVLDFFGGRTDLCAGIIRCVGDPDTRFEEDALRILRAVRFAARLGFVIEPATRAAIVRQRVGLARISRERIGDELIKILCSSAPERGVAMLVTLGLLPYVLPQGVSRSVTAHVVADDSVLPGFPRLSDLLLQVAPRLAALLWALPSDAQEANLASLRLPNTTRRAVMTLVSVCERPMIVSPREARRLRCELGDLAVPAWEIRRVHTPSDAPERAEIDRLIALIRASEVAAEPVRIVDLAIGGRDLLALGLHPGPAVQALLSDLLSLVWDDPTANTRDTLLAAAHRRITAQESG